MAYNTITGTLTGSEGRYKGITIDFSLGYDQAFQELDTPGGTYWIWGIPRGQLNVRYHVPAGMGDDQITKVAMPANPTVEDATNGGVASDALGYMDSITLAGNAITNLWATSCNFSISQIAEASPAFTIALTYTWFPGDFTYTTV